MQNIKNVSNKEQSNSIFYISVGITVMIALYAVLATEKFTLITQNVMDYLAEKFGWLYLLSMFVFVVVALILAFSKYGKIKLGPDDSVPEYSTLSWFGMLFGSGMGIGLVFYGVAEPLTHFVNPLSSVEPGTLEAAKFGLKKAIFHQGFHPWANYSLIGLAIAYFQHRKGKPGLISSIFIPILGEKRVAGPIGKTIDILAVFATVAGVATSLGIGTMQINSGLNFLFDIPETIFTQLIIIIIITVLFIGTAVSGLEKGIKKISDINLILAFSLLGLVIVFGPTINIFNNLMDGFGNYMSNFVYDSFHIDAAKNSEYNNWLKGWTIFFWAWWIAWGPFVGTFIARISKGRTIKEFVLGVMIAPTFACMIWMVSFGTFATDLGLTGKVALSELAVAATSPETSLFIVAKHYPLGILMCLITTVLLITFFVTSANSATFVLGMFTSNGDLNPSNKKKITWGLMLSLLAVGLLMAGGLKPLQLCSVAGAFPFIFINLLACVSIFKALKSDDIGIEEVNEGKIGNIEQAEIEQI